MSIRPRKLAPSTMITRGALMSPTIRPSRVISTDSLAVTFPTIAPAITQFLTWTSAFTTPVGSTTRVFVRVSVPSTRPRTVRSSSPLREPLMRIDSPMMVVPSVVVTVTSPSFP